MRRPTMLSPLSVMPGISRKSAGTLRRCVSVIFTRTLKFGDPDLLLSSVVNEPSLMVLIGRAGSYQVAARPALTTWSS